MIKVCREHVGEVVYVEIGADICPACWEIKRYQQRITELETTLRKLEVQPLSASDVQTSQTDENIVKGDT